ncbi:exodeoxyribonuclease VII, small subunit [Streptomyces aidingensis]|uniref:Exodeoxyribonuclease 7 small subunit n=1 Tax=Streptomyces aidingensis TaxID=910347 RepID=A0A1I1EQ78_9ACTN|nr:exodeoxyribonuclease VII, small subunit [Streptomyces aidingensis]
MADTADRAENEDRKREMAAEEEPALGYEQARDELIEVVRRLEAGGATLEESLALWERGEELARICRHWLEGARARLDAALAADAGADAGMESVVVSRTVERVAEAEFETVRAEAEAGEDGRG